MKIKKERTGCGLSIRADLPAAALKEKMNRAAECMNEIFVPSEVVWDGDRYSFYISHRQSLKDFIYEYGIDAEHFFTLLRKIGEVSEKALENGIAPHEFLFDYDCIFVGNSLDDLEFIYAPDADTYKDGAIVYNKCSDMAAIVSLYIEYGNSDQTERKEAAVTEALRILSDWEKKSAPDNELFPAAQLSPLLAQWGGGKGGRRLASSWYPFVISECCAVCIPAVWLIKRKEETINGFLIAAWIAVMICAGYLLLPEKKTDDHNREEKTYKYIIGAIHKIKGKAETFFRRTTNKKEACEMELDGDMLLKGIKYTINEEAYEEVHIGRDDTWADVPIGLTFVSRKHATLYKRNDRWYIKDLKSTNGTFVNGAKILPEQPLFLKNGSEISLGIPETKFIFRLP